jgi:hypothetical protein
MVNLHEASPRVYIVEFLCHVITTTATIKRFVHDHGWDDEQKSYVACTDKVRVFVFATFSVICVRSPA